MIKMEVHSTRAVIRSQEPLTVGLRGATVHFSFGKPWETLIKTAVFRQGDKTVTVADIGPEVTIPSEVLTQPGVPVQIGVYGTDNTGAIAIPTVWAQTQPVRPGTDPEGDPSTEPTPGLWEQMQGKLGSLEQLKTADKSSLVAAINEANRAVYVVTVTKNADGSYNADKTTDDRAAAYRAGKMMMCYWLDHGLLLPLSYPNGGREFIFRTVKDQTEYCVDMTSGGAIKCTCTHLATEESKLPNPKKLTFIGAAKAEYDGSEEMVIGIPTKVSQLQNDSGFLTDAPVTSVNGQVGDVKLSPPVYLVTIDGSNRAEQAYNDIMGAYREGHDIQCDYRGYLLPLKAATDTECTFSGTVDTTVFSIVVRTNGTTSITQRSLAKAADMPKKVSELENDSGFLTAAPVSSVNGQTGDVTVPTPVKVTVTDNGDGTYKAEGWTVARILEAHNAGSTVYCQHGNRVLALLVASKAFCSFGCIQGGNVHTVTINATAVTVTATPLASGGADGTDGITPHIGANGNWFIGETDTGMPSRGEAGKSAYQYALDGGYTGSEADFAEQLASDSSEMRHIKTITLEQDVQWIYIDTDENDNPFDLKELAINVYSVGAESNTDEAFFKVIPNTNLDMTHEKIIDIACGIRKKGSVRSMSFATYYNGSHCVGVGGYVDEANVFDGDMDYQATFTAVGVYGMRKISHFTSLLFGSDNRNVILGKGTKIAVWGR